MMTISESLTGRRALVTGGTKGQGAAVAARLREAGARGDDDRPLDARPELHRLSALAR